MTWPISLKKQQGGGPETERPNREEKRAFDANLHDRNSEAPPGVAEGTSPPKRLGAVHIAQRDHH